MTERTHVTCYNSHIKPARTVFRKTVVYKSDQYLKTCLDVPVVLRADDGYKNCPLGTASYTEYMFRFKCEF